MKELKKKMLSLGVFNDNEYLDLYCLLITNNKKQKRIKYKTQLHHVIPCCLYESRTQANRDPENPKVHLQYKDHVLAHYYLVQCASDQVIQAKLFLAVKYQLGWNRGGKGLTQEETRFRTDFELSEDFQLLYEQTKQAVSRLRCVYLDKPVICIETQEIFADIYEATQSKGVQFIERACTGQYLTAGKYHWCWLDDKERQKQLKQYIGKTPKSGYRGHNNIQVVCIETGIVYDSVLAAKRATGATKILECIYQIRNKSGGLHWAKAGDTARINELKLLIAGTIKSSTITTKSEVASSEVQFYSWTDEEVAILRDQYLVKGSDIPELLMRHSKNTIRQKAHKLGLTYDYKASARCIRCIETGQLFSSVAEVVLNTNITRNSLYSSLNTGCKAGGYHWEYYI